MTPKMIDGLRLAVMSGEVSVMTSPNVMLDNAIASRTAFALEKLGYLERIHTGPQRGKMVPTGKGVAALVPYDLNEEFQ